MALWQDAVILAEHGSVLIGSVPVPYWPGSRRLERRRRIAASADVAMVARRPAGVFAEDSAAED